MKIIMKWDKCYHYVNIYMFQLDNCDNWQKVINAQNWFMIKVLDLGKMSLTY
jgi:hypothetical protein